MLSVTLEYTYSCGSVFSQHW